MSDPQPEPLHSSPIIPSPLQSLGIFAAAVLVLHVGVAVVQVLGAAVMTAEQREGLLDPATSLLLNDPGWLALGVAIPLLLVGAGLVRVVRLFRMPTEVVFPLRIPGTGSIIGALLVVFGLAPLADATHNAVAQTSLQPDDVSTAEIVGQALSTASWSQLIWLIVGLALIPAVVEEALFRGLITAAHRKSFWAAWFAPAVLFGLFHFEPAHVAAMLVLGLGFGLARLFSGSLVPPILAHASYNGVVIVTAVVSPSVANEPPSATAIALGIVLALVGVVLLPWGRVVDEPAPASSREHS